MASSTSFSFYCIVFLLVNVLGAFSAHAPPPVNAANADRVTSLPGVDHFNLSMYAGMVTVDDTAGRALFYLLAESTSGNAANDPLVLWLNGGRLQFHRQWIPIRTRTVLPRVKRKHPPPQQLCVQ
jgi:hypothetical protein